jgi:hypothetical protein
MRRFAACYRFTRPAEMPTPTPMMDCSHSFHDGALTPYAVWYSAIATTARVSVLLGCRSSSRIVK